MEKEKEKEGSLWTFMIENLYIGKGVCGILNVMKNRDNAE